MEAPHKTAIVIGAGIAGLLSALALKEHFSQVEIFDRRKGPGEGVAQGEHAHALLQRGLTAMEALAPGLLQSLEHQGAVPTIATRDWRTHLPTGVLPSFDSDIALFACTRPFLEQVLYQKALDAGIASHYQKRVTGVIFENRTATGITLDTDETRTANLIVDASGRASQAKIWLVENGFPEATVTLIDPQVSYSSRFYQRPDPWPWPWKALLVFEAAPQTPKGAVLMPQEKGRLLLTLSTRGKGKPPANDEELQQHLRSISSPEMQEIVKVLAPCSPIKTFSKLTNRWFHYEHLSSWPQNFLVIGDAVCGFDPIYGQGIASGAMSVEALQQSLPNFSTKNWAMHTQKSIARQVAIPWRIATSEDRRWPQTLGVKNHLIHKIQHRFGDLVQYAATQNPKVGYQFFRVMHLMAPQRRMLYPDILFRIALALTTKTSRPPA